MFDVVYTPENFPRAEDFPSTISLDFPMFLIFLYLQTKGGVACWNGLSFDVHFMFFDVIIALFTS